MSAATTPAPRAQVSLEGRGDDTAHLAQEPEALGSQGRSHTAPDPGDAPIAAGGG